MFPPEIIPPGVYVDATMSEVTSPLSLPEWFHNFYSEARRKYGPAAKDPAFRNKMKEGTCDPGEIVYVPTGWWHLVINLESSIAVTQNYVADHNLGQVLFFLKHRSDQISGFRDQDRLLDVYSRFVEVLAEKHPKGLEKGTIRRKDRKKA